MKIKVLVVVMLIASSAFVVVSDGADATTTDKTYDYSNVNSYYFNGNYVRITESIDESGKGIKADGSLFTYDLIKTEYVTYPNTDESYPDFDI